ncbi:MAG: aldo/keto reductase [Clostridia bacterium]|nr:aldo/keto reductase [Clostridia bacterium]
MSFEKIKGKLGFGCMRLAMDGDKVNYPLFNQMIDFFMQSGFNYFDTAHIYLNGESEKALKKCLAERYPREDFVLTDKLSFNCFSRQEDIRPFVKKQLELCGVDYFDFYLMHAQSRESYKKYKACKAYQTAFELKKEGLIKHVGLSFHDTADVLDMILTENPQIEVVQIQFNYLDYESPVNQSKLCYEVCRKHGKPVLVMEPVRGGRLANLSGESKAVLDELDGNCSYASYALRFVAGFDGIISVLSGMGSMDMITDNVKTFKDLKPITKTERVALEKVAEILNKESVIPCTNCRYCVDGCPKKIAIPDIFALYNNSLLTNVLREGDYEKITANGGKATDCISCGKCESACPQQIKIRKYLDHLGWIFEKK